jgi:hypothetical protein
VRNFITTRCAIVIGTSLLLILNSTNCVERSVRLRVEEGPHTPPPHRTRSFTQSCSLAGCNWQEVGLYLICLSIYIWMVSFKHRPLLSPLKTTDIFWIGSWVGPRAGFGRFGEKEIYLVRPGIEPNSSFVRPVPTEIFLPVKFKVEITLDPYEPK